MNQWEEYILRSCTYRNGKRLEDELPLKQMETTPSTIDTLAAHLFGNMLKEDDCIINQVGRLGAKRLSVLAKFLPEVPYNHLLARGYKPQRIIMASHSWSDLPTNILTKVAERLSYSNQCHFGAACKSWRVALDGVQQSAIMAPLIPCSWEYYGQIFSIVVEIIDLSSKE
ncbi:Homeodomain-like protein [Prunus dulcis]|uniref:Homeodomain-like protein n=1 Tax=Prunus dulcis TaxID=3755 RepID=A0A4Y1RD94_PRUDU|nr:Homeodomain-like protein [Prunus dulcis]